MKTNLSTKETGYNAWGSKGTTVSKDFTKSKKNQMFLWNQSPPEQPTQTQTYFWGVILIPQHPKRSDSL